MNIFGTQMHWLTALLTSIAIIFFFIQFYHYLTRPQDRQRLWYLVLLALLIAFNIANGLLPDNSFALDMRLQYMIAYGSAYLMGSYNTYYFYKAYGFRELRFFATWGILLFNMLPFIIFDVIYALNGQLMIDQEWGVIIPGLYGLLVLSLMFRAILRHYRRTGNKAFRFCTFAVWLAILPWEVMCLFAFYPAPQWLRIALANIGWVTITLLQFDKAIRFSRAEHQQLRGKSLEITKEQLTLICREYGLSERIADVAWLWGKGYSKQAVADALFISKDTVKSHISKLYKTLDVSGHEEFLRKLNSLAKKPPNHPGG